MERIGVLTFAWRVTRKNKKNRSVFQVVLYFCWLILKRGRPILLWRVGLRIFCWLIFKAIHPCSSTMGEYGPRRPILGDEPCDFPLGWAMEKNSRRVDANWCGGQEQHCWCEWRACYLCVGFVGVLPYSLLSLQTPNEHETNAWALCWFLWWSVVFGCAWSLAQN